jgi:hypothetical protein
MLATSVGSRGVICARGRGELVEEDIMSVASGAD